MNSPFYPLLSIYLREECVLQSTTSIRLEQIGSKLCFKTKKEVRAGLLIWKIYRHKHRLILSCGGSSPVSFSHTREGERIP